MRFDLVEALRAKLKADAALTGFCTTRFGRDAQHWIGLKEARNANDCPVILYVPVKEKALRQQRIQTCALVLTVNRADITGQVMEGLRDAADLSEAVAAAITNSSIPLGSGMTVLSLGETYSDLGARHPFYSLELSVELQQVL